MKSAANRMTMFSIIIPVYNVAPWLRECLDLVLAQTYEVWECICVDDGSTDGSGKILDEYSERDRRFRIVHQQNGGVSAARNAAIRIANGEWVIFQDADDIMPHSTLQDYRSAIIDYPETDIVRGVRREFMDGESVDCGIRRGELKKTFVDLRESLPFSELSPTCACATFRADIVKRLSFSHYTIGEDRLFVGRVLVHAKGCVQIDSFVYGYRVRRDSASTSSMSVRKERDRLGFSEDWLRVLVGSGKRVDPLMYHEIGISVTEWFVYDLCRLRTDERLPLWRLWWMFLSRTRDLRTCFRLWTRFIMNLNDRIHCRALALMTCALPMKLKLMGLHR